jgi:glycosyltransferase involved in cell wall biosynthesis
MYVRARDAITPVILTLNEEANIRSTLEPLSWARRVIVLDSGSTDRTETIAKTFQNVDWMTRRFDTHAEQWRHALTAAGVSTEYALALDADMRVSDDLLRETESAFLDRRFAGGLISFEFRVYGRELAGTLCPAQLRLFRPGGVRISQPGHTQCFSIDGPVYDFTARLVHEDRKPLDLWLASQLRYARLERDRLESAPRGGWKAGWKDVLRRRGLMPPIAALAAWLRAGGPFGGAQARFYASQRLAYECILQMQLLESRLTKSPADAPAAETDRRAI